MKFKSLFMTAAALTTCVACSDYDPGLSDSVVNLTDEEVATLSAYTENFTERYGAIDPEQTWGFGDIGSEGTRATRAIATYKNENQWYQTQSDWDEPQMAQYLKDAGFESVPGYPMDNQPSDSKYSNKYICQNGNGTTYHLSDTPQDIPAGDVTDEEIQFVTMWFRAHYLEDTPFYEKDFFVQDISADKDYTENPVWNDTNDAAWRAGKWKDDLSAEWLEPRVATVDGQEGRTETITFQLDQLVVNEKTNPEFNGWDTEGWVHVQDFNNGATTWLPYDEDGAFKTPTKRTINFVTSDGCNAISCHASSANNNEWQSHYHLEHLKFTINGRTYEGDYLGFDYEIKDGVKTLERDHHYNNWILKITGSGTATPPSDDEEEEEEEETHNWYRVMCEDLGNTHDFDFNDLVFDVYFTGEAPNYEAHIKVQAAGGTMPIYIGQVDEAHEAHNILGQSDTSRAINVNSNRRNPVTTTWTWPTGTSTNPKDIPVFVTTIQNKATANITRLPDAGKGSEFAPQKICIPGNTTRWTKEGQQIEWAYPSFPTWVQNASAAGYNSETPWNTTNVQESYLFK